MNIFHSTAVSAVPCFHWYNKFVHNFNPSQINPVNSRCSVQTWTRRTFFIVEVLNRLSVLVLVWPVTNIYLLSWSS